jgi:signal transduction histidine kinase
LPQELPHYPLSSEARHNLFLTFQEALNNVLKHSGASKVKVEMVVSSLECEFRIEDNGRGFEVATLMEQGPQTRRGGNGLRNMRQRIKAIGGDCLVSSRPGAGTTVNLRLALAKEPL